jgi:hypothetical protein
MYGDILGALQIGLVPWGRGFLLYSQRGRSDDIKKNALESWKYPSILLCGIGISN